MADVYTSMPRPRPAPDFVIVGGPKCGTTSLYAALREHPQVFLSAIKEPHYFASEKGTSRAIETQRAYEALFARATQSQIRGEASVSYLSSKAAIPALLQHRPDIRIIAMVRNPADMFISWHNSCIVSRDEDEPDAERAWRLQSTRAAGKRLPRWCSDPGTIQYRQICSLGSQVKRLYRLVPASQRLVLLLDDLESNPAETWSRVTSFLGIAQNSAIKVSQENRFSTPRSPAVALIAQALKVWRPLKWLRLSLKGALNRRGIYVFELLFRANLVPSPRPQVSPAFMDELRQDFEEEIRMLESLLQRDLSQWRKPRPANLLRASARATG